MEEWFEKNKKWLIPLGIIAAVVWVVFLWPHTDTWDGDGEISVFPNSLDAKNYRLTAQIEVVRHRNGWMYGSADTEYTVTQFSWPNGGDADLKNCVVKNKSQASCTDQDGKSYNIEVTTPPEQPEADTSSDN